VGVGTTVLLVLGAVAVVGAVRPVERRTGVRERRC
jgi:hypothetical protein